MAENFISLSFRTIAGWLDEHVRWDHLPTPVAVATLEGLRSTLREENLFDTGGDPDPSLPPMVPDDPRWDGARSPDGSHNDPQRPAMGMAGMRFGRNVPIPDTWPEPDERVMTPNPRTVSRRLMTRETFQPATILNVLAAAWLQFEVHDWFSHGRNEQANPWVVALDEDDPWPQHPMTVLRTRKDPTSDPDEPPTYRNTETHWWDASQVYGSDPAFEAKLRTGVDGKLILSPQGTIPIDPVSLGDVAGVAGNWWLGLALLHTVFMNEHNALCDALKQEHPDFTDDELYDKARLINAALIAKIHTVEWTTAILDNPVLQIGMRANWWGLLGQHVHEILGRLGPSEVLSGIPGSPTNQFTAPYAITEEFVAVYRMHPLIPDDYSLRSARDDSELAAKTFPEIAGTNARSLIDSLGMTDLLYSFGVANPGAVTLHNFPRFLQEFRRQDTDVVVDLATIDILRSRERGVPRYNEFRRLLHLEPAATFEDLTPNPTWQAELREVYGDVEQVDLSVGLEAEQPPAGFGFSDTAFRIFILMASRRLKSDRFFTTDFTPEVYTQLGMDWIERETMVSVLRRHYPDLGPVLADVHNAFTPWPRVSPTPGSG